MMVTKSGVGAMCSCADLDLLSVAGDYVCVQSMDGQLSFFVHESFAFAVFLPDFLTPGPLCYLPRTDSIVTANSSRQLQCFQ